MRTLLFLISLLSLSFIDCLAQHPDAVLLPVAKFSTGNDAVWKTLSFDDGQWKEIRTGEVWQAQGYPDYHGYAWYRIHVVIPSSLRANGHWKDSLRIFLAHVNDVDETWLNGVRIGKIGSFPEDPAGYNSKWPAIREYHIAMNDPAIKWDGDNVIAVKDYDGGGTGGIFMGHPYLDMLEKTDGLTLNCSAENNKYLPDGKTETPVVLSNSFNTAVKGILTYKVYDAAAGKDLSQEQIPVVLKPFGKKKWMISVPSRQGIQYSYAFTEAGTGLSISGRQIVPYLLTPAPAEWPRINSTKVFGVRPGSPFC